MANTKPEDTAAASAETETVATETAPKAPRKPAGSNFTVEQLLGKLAPSVAAENDPLEQHRKQVAEQVESLVSNFAQSLVATLAGTTDEVSIKAALVSLETVRLRGVKAAKGTSPAV